MASATARPSQAAEVAGPEPAVMKRRLLSTPASIGVARDAVHRFGHFHREIPASLLSQAVQCMSELAANATAVTPVAETIEIRLELVPGRLTVSVWDPDPGEPKQAAESPWTSLEAIDTAPEDQAFGGWGLLVASYGASDRQLIRTRHGKRVCVTFAFGVPA